MLTNYLPDTLNFRMGRQEQSRFVIASLLPLFVVLSLVYQLGYELWGEGPPQLGGEGTWWRIYYVVSFTDSSLAAISAAAMVFMGIARPTYAVGSWSAVVAGCGILVALFATLYSALPHLFLDPYDPSINDWHTDLAYRVGYYFGLMAIGYAFLAYRGLNVVITERDGETVFEEPDPNLIVDTWPGDEEPVEADDETLA